MNELEERIRAAVSTVTDPFAGTDLVSAGFLDRIEHGKDGVTVHLCPGYPAGGYGNALAETVRERVAAVAGAGTVSVELKTDIYARHVPRGTKLLPGVRNIIAVSSGKGGVGKSTVAVNLACALKKLGASVGLMDADIYGPSVPLLAGTYERPTTPDGKSMNPVAAHGIQLMSVGFLTDDDSPLAWRSPMALKALMQLITDTRWIDLDYLIIDMPPGTGDFQLTLAQQVPLTGAIVVTTPQEVAALDAKKGLELFDKMGVNVLGIVENMALFVCPHCGKTEHVFGEGGAQRMGEMTGVPVLGSLPISASVSTGGDEGVPVVIGDPDSDIAKTFTEIAMKATAKLATLPRNHSAGLPGVSVE